MIVLVTVLVTRVVPMATRSYTTFRDNAHDAVEQLARAQALIATQDIVRDSLRMALDSLLKLGPRLISIGTTLEAEDRLAEIVEGAAMVQGLRVLQLIPVRYEGPTDAVTRVGVHAELEGDLTAMAGLLGSLEADRRVLSLDTLRVRRREQDSFPKANELQIGMDVSGLFLMRDERNRP